MKLHSLRWHSVYVAPVRLGLGVVWLVAGRASGVASTSALLAFGSGLFAIVFLVSNDPRRAFLLRRQPEAIPPDAQVASVARQTVVAMYPSTIGLSVLAAIALVVAPVLAVLLGGISAGLGVAGAVNAVRADRDLYFDPRSGRLFRRS